MVDPYFYPETEILINKFNIREQKLLNDAEADYVSLRLRELAENPLPGKYDVQHFLVFHKYIFQDLFDWAGKTRTINMTKSEPVLGGLSIEYAEHEKITQELTDKLARVQQIAWLNSSEELAKELSAAIADVWKIHPFREGNTRTTITFFCQLIDEKYKKINRKIFEENAAYVRTALVAYCADFGEAGDYSKKEYLEKIVLDAIS